MFLCYRDMNEGQPSTVTEAPPTSHFSTFAIHPPYLSLPYQRLLPRFGAIYFSPALNLNEPLRTQYLSFVGFVKSESWSRCISGPSITCPCLTPVSHLSHTCLTPASHFQPLNPAACGITPHSLSKSPNYLRPSLNTGN